jgi:WD40 repeat protein
MAQRSRNEDDDEWTWSEERRSSTRVACILTGVMGTYFCCAACSPTGEFVAAGANDGNIYVWSVSGAMTDVLHGHMDAVQCVSWSHDGKYIASGSHDKHVRIWSTTDNRKGVLLGHTNSVISVSWSPDGQTLASRCWDGLVKLWDTSEYIPKPENADSVLCVGNHTMLWGQSACRLEWDLYKGCQSPDKTKIAAISPGQHVVVSDCRRNSLYLDLYFTSIQSFLWMPNSQQIVIVGASWEMAIVTVCPWSDRVHHLFAPAFKARVFYLMCVRQRLRAQGHAYLPMENWLDIFSVLVRRDPEPPIVI